MQVTNKRNELSVAPLPVYVCGRCTMCYYDYRLLLEHLYWRHGTESRTCSQCGLKRWKYAAHICHVLPIFIQLLDDEEDTGHCFCGERVDVPMIGCDGPHCEIQWYHFSCVGVVTPPEGDWLCPTCSNKASQAYPQNHRQEKAQT